jgi:4-amino-4-deoxy-L-arabinose transferase-like glycosyltransferase
MELVNRLAKSALREMDRSKAAFLIGIGALGLINLWSLMRYPAPHPDEAILLSRAWSYVTSGHQLGILDRGLLDGMDQVWIVNQWLITFLQSLIIRFFPAPLLLPLRVFSLFLGAVLLVAVYFFSKHLGGKSLAYASCLLLACSRAFLHSAHQARFDILAATLSYLALTIAVLDRKGRFLLGLLAGLLTGLAAETHLNSLIFIPAIGMVYLIYFGWRSLKTPSCWGYMFGCCIGLVYYLSLHYFPNPETSRYINTLVFGAIEQPPILSWNIARISISFVEVLGLLLVSSGSMLFLALLAVPALWSKHTQPGWIILGVNAALIITAALIMPNKVGHYAIYLAPAFTVAVAFFLLEYSMRPWKGKIADYALRVFVLAMTIGGIALGLAVLTPDNYTTFQKGQAAINGVVQADDIVMGNQVYWMGLPNQKYFPAELLNFYGRVHPGATLADAFYFFHTNIFIFDPEMRALTADNVDPTSRWYLYHYPKQELEEFLAKHASLALAYEDASGSLIQVYRITEGQQ